VSERVCVCVCVRARACVHVHRDVSFSLRLFGDCFAFSFYVNTVYITT
jgi:hypothetical protein